MTQFWRFETSTVHAGHEPDADSHSIATPIYPSAAFAFDSAQHSADLFDGVVDGYIYSRIANPTVRSLEARLGTLEQGIGAVAFASGQAAVASAVQTIAVQTEFQFTFAQLFLRRLVTDRFPNSAIPKLHGAAAVLAFRNRAFEVAVVERMIFDLDCKALIVWIE